MPLGDVFSLFGTSRLPVLFRWHQGQVGSPLELTEHRTILFLLTSLLEAAFEDLSAQVIHDVSHEHVSHNISTIPFHQYLDQLSSLRRSSILRLSISANLIGRRCHFNPISVDSKLYACVMNCYRTPTIPDVDVLPYKPSNKVLI